MAIGSIATIALGVATLILAGVAIWTLLIQRTALNDARQQLATSQEQVEASREAVTQMANQVTTSQDLVQTLSDQLRSEERHLKFNRIKEAVHDTINLATQVQSYIDLLKPWSEWPDPLELAGDAQLDAVRDSLVVAGLNQVSEAVVTLRGAVNDLKQRARQRAMFASNVDDPFVPRLGGHAPPPTPDEARHREERAKRLQDLRAVDDHCTHLKAVVSRCCADLRERAVSAMTSAVGDV